MLKTIALDAMGGDHGPSVVVPAAVQALKQHANVNLILVGQEDLLSPLLRQHAKDVINRITVHHATEVVTNDDSPSSAMRHKKDSSMRVAINLVQRGEAQACVSAGNTGALMATARFVLKTLPGIDRPAIVTSFPTHAGREVRILDLGANVDSTPENLYQFAVMGSILTSALKGCENPRVALLNIGVEEIKGNELVKKAAEVLAEKKGINYIGYIEADKMFQDLADVIVCDGFVGNIMLKTIEGALKFIADIAREEFLKNIFTKMLIAPARPIISRLVNRANPDSYNGATLLGLNGIVVKSHGSAKVNAFASAIGEAIAEIEKNIPELIKQRVASMLNTEGEKR